MGVLVGAVQHEHSLAAPLTAIGVIFVLMQALGPVHDAVSTNLGAKVSAWLHDRLMEACAGPPGLAHLERPDLADDLSAAREFDLGLIGPSITVCMPNIGAGFVGFVGGALQALILFGYRWWAPFLVAGAWGSTHWLLKGSAIWLDRQSDEVVEQQRKASYAYRLSVDAPAAKEMRLFGLADWVVGGFASLRPQLMDLSWEQRRLGRRGARWAMAIIVVANGVFLWSLARDADAGRVAVGALVVFAQAAIGASAVAFGGQNGAGKTTLAKLVCRMYDPTAGAIRIDGTDVRELYGMQAASYK
jgi:hypothetical protein